MFFLNLDKRLTFSGESNPEQLQLFVCNVPHDMFELVQEHKVKNIANKSAARIWLVFLFYFKTVRMELGAKKFLIPNPAFKPNEQCQACLSIVMA